MTPHTADTHSSHFIGQMVSLKMASTAQTQSGGPVQGLELVSNHETLQHWRFFYQTFTLRSCLFEQPPKPLQRCSSQGTELYLIVKGLREIQTCTSSVGSGTESLTAWFVVPVEQILFLLIFLHIWALKDYITPEIFGLWEKILM